MTKRNNWRPRKRYNTYRTNSYRYRNGRRTTGYKMGTRRENSLINMGRTRPRPIPRGLMEVMRKWGPQRTSDYWFKHKI